MGLETATYISELDNSFPLGGDPINKGDDHLRLLKTVLQAQFPNLTAAALNATVAEFNSIIGLITEFGLLSGLTSTSAELNKLDGATMSTAELNFLVGVLGAIIDTQGGQTIADLIITNALSSGQMTVNGELIINSGYSEDDDSYTVGVGTKSLDLEVATYFHPTSAMTAVAVDFTFDNPAASGRVSSFTLELNNMVVNTDSTPWPGSVDWAGGLEPIWTSGIDIVTFVTRDGGTVWLGFAAGLDMS